METIKAIETYYNGYRFRSRLEARWAVFFDALGIKYQYEVEGFNCGDGVYYLPDFYLPEENCYVEVKGTDRALQADGNKIALAVDFGHTPCSEGLLILGDIPNPALIKWGNIPMFSYLYNHKGIVHEYAAFVEGWMNHLVRGSKNILARIFAYDDSDVSDAYAECTIPMKSSTECKWSKDELMSYDFKKLAQAYTAARQARFEHGETPNNYTRR